MLSEFILFTSQKPYCWTCYRDGSEAYCAECGIGFHPDCVGENAEYTHDLDSCLEKIIWIKECVECQSIKESRRLYDGTDKRTKFKRLPKSLINEILREIFTKGIGVKVEYYYDNFL